MGQYLGCGIATMITVKKKSYYALKTFTKEEIIDEIKNEIKLDIYNIEEDEDKVYFTIKRELFEKNVTSFIIEQLKKINLKNQKEDIEEIRSLEGKKYDELMDVAKRKSLTALQYLEGCEVTNDISYLSDNHIKCYADLICYFSEGKAFFECYSNLFKYFRKLILESSNNPIKEATVVTIIG